MLEVNTLSFPGLGIGEFNVNEVAFSIFGLDVYWYGILIVTGMLLALWYVSFRVKAIGMDFDTLLTFFMVCIVCGVIGARLYYVIMSPSEYNSFADVINLRKGGLAIYGGIICGVVAAGVMCKIYRVKILKFFDCAVLGITVGQILGRWGNFVNAEAHGGVTDNFLRMGIKQANGGFIYVHPTFLYESLWNLLGFMFINLFYKHKKYDGQIFLMYIAWYGFGRMLIEGLRTDSLYIGSTGIRVSQLVGFCCFAVCGGIMAYMFVKEKLNKKNIGE